MITSCSDEAGVLVEQETLESELRASGDIDISELEAMERYIVERQKDVRISKVGPDGSPVDCILIADQPELKALVRAGLEVPTAPSDV